MASCCLKEWWKLLLVLCINARGLLQEHLCGVLVFSLIDGLCTHNSMRAGAAVRNAAHSVFTQGLQQQPLTQLLSRVLPRLGDDEKTRLRAGLLAAEQSTGASGVSSGVRGINLAAAANPRIDFAAFSAAC